MTTLADDIETLERYARKNGDWFGESNCDALDRVVAILTPLAELSEDQIRGLIDHHLDVALEDEAAADHGCPASCAAVTRYCASARAHRAIIAALEAMI